MPVELDRLNLRPLDALRGFLATYIVMGHARWLLWCGNVAFVASGASPLAKAVAASSAALRYSHEIVMVFFVLSGFFIHLRVAQQLAGSGQIKFSASDFYRRRAHRLVAPYVFALLVTLAFDLTGRAWFPTLYHAKTGDGLLDYNFARTGFSGPAVWPALVMLPMSFGKEFGTNGPLWSLAFEVVYYALYPLWIIVRRQGPWLAYGLVGCALLGISLFPKPTFLSNVLADYPVWLAGALLAELVIYRPEMLTRSWACVLGAVAGFGGTMIFSGGAPAVAFSIIAGMSIVAGFLSLPSSASSLLVMRSLEFLGLRSYTIYISHFPFLAFLSAFVFQEYGSRPLSGWLAVAGTVASLILAMLWFEIAERRVLPARLHVTNNPGPAARLQAKSV